MPNAELMKRLALQGAMARLNEIQEELRVIYAEFPELRRASGARGAQNVLRPRRPGPNKGRKFSVDVKKRMSEGMRKYWARRKAAAKNKASQNA